MSTYKLIPAQTRLGTEFYTVQEMDGDVSRIFNFHALQVTILKGVPSSFAETYPHIFNEKSQKFDAEGVSMLVQTFTEFPHPEKIEEARKLIKGLNKPNFS